MINCQAITKTYQSGELASTVLKDVSLKINDGEFVAIIGPSGSGKSTLMHILGALDTPTSGHYEIDGQDVSKMSDDDLAELRKSKIGFVFQAFNLLPRATVLRNAALPLVYAEVPAAERDERAKKALRNAGLDEHQFFKLSNQLSGGQQQRVAIARALVNDPSLLLADEPTGNLDTHTGTVVLQTFQQLNEQGKTIVLITHDPDVAAHAHRIVTIRDGVIVSDRANKAIAKGEL